MGQRGQAFNIVSGDDAQILGLCEKAHAALLGAKAARIALLEIE